MTGFPEDGTEMTDHFDARRSAAPALLASTRRHFFADCGVEVGGAGAGVAARG